MHNWLVATRFLIHPHVSPLRYLSLLCRQDEHFQSVEPALVQALGLDKAGLPWEFGGTGGGAAGLAGGGAGGGAAG